MTATTPITFAGDKRASFIEDPQELGDAIAEAADLIAPFVPMTSTDIATAMAHFLEELRSVRDSDYA